jgi:hypothetical protein
MRGECMNIKPIVEGYAQRVEFEQNQLVQQLTVELNELTLKLHHEKQRYAAMMALREDEYKLYFEGRMSVSGVYELNVQRHRDALWKRKPVIKKPHAEKEPKVKTVYLITSESGLSKIGVSGDVWERLKALQAMSPIELKLLGYKTVKRAVKLERELHARFKDRRRHGEWFDLTEDDIHLFFTEYKFSRIDT